MADLTRNERAELEALRSKVRHALNLAQSRAYSPEHSRDTRVEALLWLRQLRGIHATTNRTIDNLEATP